MVVRGGGELATAAARLLHLGGFPVVVLEREQPLAVRRKVSFAEAVFSGEVVVEGVLARRVAAEQLAVVLDEARAVPVLVDPEGASLPRLGPAALLDGRMAKTNLGTRPDQAPLVIGLGPGFTAGRDVHAVIETQRGSDLGAVIWRGAARADSALPAPVEGVTEKRVLRAPRAGRFRAGCAIGDLVAAGDSVGEVGGATVVAGVGGRVRGLLAGGVAVGAGVKVGDIDPRGAAVDPARISDKARAVAAGALEAVLLGLRERG